VKRILYLFIILLISPLLFQAQTEEQLLKSLKNATDDSTRLSLMLDLADFYTFSNPDVAIGYFQQTDNELKQANKPEFKFLRAIYYNRIGTYYSVKGNYVDALESFQRGLTIIDSLKRKYPRKAILQTAPIATHANMAIIFMQQGNYQKAILHFKMLIQNAGDNLSDQKKILIFNNIGVGYKYLKQHDSALYYYNKAFEMLDTNSFRKEAAMLYTNMGEVYGDKGDYNKAIGYYKKSIKIKKEIDDKYGLANVLFSMAESQYKTGAYQQSTKNGLEALDVCMQNHFLKEQRNCYELLAKNAEALSDIPAAYQYFKKFKALNDSIFNDESNSRLMELETKYETKKKDDEITLLHQKQKTEKLLREILIAGILIILFIAFLVVRAIVVKRKNEQRIFAINRKLKKKENKLIRATLEKEELKSKELNLQVEFKSKQLTTHALNMMQKNKMLKNLISEIDDIIKHAKPEVKTELNKIKRHIKQSVKNDKEWEAFKLYFEQINEGFFDKLVAINSSLNIYDLRHCALIKLNLNIKETASALNLSPNTIKSARYRLKKKLSLEQDDDLYDFLRSL